MKIHFVIIFTLIFVQLAFAQTNTKKLKPYNCHICKPISLPQPKYPEAAKYIKVSGKVVVQVFVDKKGNVESTRAISGHPLLQAASVKAAYLAKFNKPPLSGKRFVAYTSIEYNFISSESSQLQKEELQNKQIKIGIINGSATFLPKPDYSQEAKNLCAEGKVEVLVELMASGGKPFSAKAVSGDELLKKAAEKAALKALFRPFPGVKEDFKIEGIIVYNFVPMDKCINAGIVNKKAIELPKPTISNIVHPRHLKLSEAITIEVIVIIDETGKVTQAKANSGHPLFRFAFENAARKAKFPPTFINGKMPKIRGIIVYKINPDATIETDF